MVPSRFFKVCRASDPDGIIRKPDFIVVMSVTVKEDMLPQYVERGEVLLKPLLIAFM